MDLTHAARFFQKDVFDSYDFNALGWRERDFKGKLKFAPESFSVNDLATRKRMLYCAPQEPPTSTVIRCVQTQAVYLVEGTEHSLFNDVPYLQVYNLHTVVGAAELWRKAPTGPSNDPGWATNVKQQDTFADIGFDRTSTDQNDAVNQYGFYTLYLPSDCSAIPHDTVTLQGVQYFLFDVYWEQGLRVAKVTKKPDPRVNAVYTVVVEGAYNPATLSPSKTKTNYNVTLEIEPRITGELVDQSAVQDVIKVLINSAWIGVIPKLNDEITALGKTYVVTRINQNKSRDQWEILANV